MVRYPGINTSDLKNAIPQLSDADPQILARIDITIRSSPSFPICWFHYCSLHVGQYSAHILQQEADLRVFMEDESLLLDPLMDYSTVTALSSEVKERLFKLRPTTMVSSLHRSMLLY